MSESIPETHLDLIAGPYYAVFTTINPDGAPENSLVWCSWDGEHVLVNTAKGRRKDRNVRQNPDVAVFVLDPQDNFRWIDVRGFVAEIVPDPEAENISAHAKLYVGVDSYYGDYQDIELKGKEEREIIKIRPEHVVTLG
jgi:PPOX class probable F420-dependent enzyme